MDIVIQAIFALGAVVLWEVSVVVAVVTISARRRGRKRHDALTEQAAASARRVWGTPEPDDQSDVTQQPVLRSVA